MPKNKIYQRNKEKYRKEGSSWYYKNREHVLNLRLQRKRENPERFRIANKRYYIKHKDNKEYKIQRQKYTNSLLGKYHNYINGAKQRNKEFLLTLEQFQNFWGQPCHYCNEEIKTIGLDRKENNLGYILENLVPCCKQCNIMKKAMSYQFFIEICKKISNNHSPKGVV